MAKRLLQQQSSSLQRRQPSIFILASNYHSTTSISPPQPYTSTETSILNASLRHVPAHGFTNQSVALGAKSAGFLPASANLFPDKPFALVKYHLHIQRLALENVDLSSFEEQVARAGGRGEGEEKSADDIWRNVQALTWRRLKGNKDIIRRWPEAVAILTQPTHLPFALTSLHSLSSTILHLSGQTTLTPAWYSSRAALAAIYSASELHMTQDTSEEFTATEEFLERRLTEARAVGDGWADVKEWVGFTGHAVFNVLRSKGVRI